jgi:hypothetical protein
MAKGNFFRTALSLVAITQLAACNVPSRPRVISAAGVPKTVTDESDKFQSSLYSRFVDNATAAYPKAGQPSTDPAVQRQFLYSGLALIRTNCNAYIESKSDRQRDINVWRDAFAPITALATGIIDLVDKNGSADNKYLLAIGLWSGASSAGFDIYEQRFLFGAKNVNSVRRLIEEALVKHATEALKTSDANMTYEQAVVHLLDNQMICSPANILELVGKAITAGTVEAASVTKANGTKPETTSGTETESEPDNKGVSSAETTDPKPESTNTQPTLDVIRVDVVSPKG